MAFIVIASAIEPSPQPTACRSPAYSLTTIISYNFLQDPDIGTFRAPLSLSALVRILTRLLSPRKENKDNEEFNAMWKSQANFFNTLNNGYGDVVLDNRTVFTVVQVQTLKSFKGKLIVGKSTE